MDSQPNEHEEFIPNIEPQPIYNFFPRFEGILISSGSNTTTVDPPILLLLILTQWDLQLLFVMLRP